MNALVHGQVLLDGEGLGADGAHVGLLTSVRALVARQPGRQGKMLAADVAGKLAARGAAVAAVEIFCFERRW